MSRKKILLIGDLPLATMVLRAVRVRGEAEVVAVITQYKDREFKNDPWPGVPGLYSEAVDSGIPVFHSPKALMEAMPSVRFDIGLSCRASIIYKADFIDRFDIGLINMHGGLLPSRAGLHIACHSVIEGDEEGGATLHLITPAIDEGDILARKSFPIGPDDTAFDVYQKTQLALLDLFGTLLDDLIAGKLASRSQAHFIAQGERRVYFGKNALEAMKLVDPSTMTEDEIDRRVRGCAFPGHEPCYMMVKGRKVYLSHRY